MASASGDALAEARAIDRERMWIVGWSGGGSYIGFRTQQIEQAFAAIVIHGGGIPPASSYCPRSRVPVYFLVGDMNPLHALAVRLRDHYEVCDDDVTWTLLKGADHDGERRALAAHRERILDWLETKRLPASTADAAAPPKATSSSSAAPPTPGPPAIAPPTHASSCRCSSADIATPRGAAAALGPLAALVLASRRRRRHQGRPGRTPSTR